MSLSETEIELIVQHIPLEEEFLPHISIDCVLFGYHNKELKVFCTKAEALSEWYLPSGNVKKNEGINQAAYRILKERTGVDNLFLKQFQTFGDENRSLANSEFAKSLNKLPVAISKRINWQIAKRYVSISYYALVEFSKVIPHLDFFSAEYNWADVEDLPPMILDHQQIIREALKTMRRELHYEPIGLNLLTQKFTLSEIQALYETILGRKLDTRNFVKKLMSADILRKTNEKKHIGGHRAPTLYKFNKRAYNKALKQEFELIF